MKLFLEYGTSEYQRDGRQFAVSTRNKVDYLISVLNSCGESVEIISYSRSQKRFGFCPKRMEKINENVTLTNAPAFCFGNRRFGKCLQTAIMSIWLFLYLLIKTKENEDVLVYHALTFAYIFLIAKKIKKFKMILEVEEIYHLLVKLPNFIIKSENRMFSSADKYLFASENIEKIVNVENKPYCIFSGNYHAEERYCTPAEDDLIKLVYAGSIKYDLVAFKALEISRYLPDKYRMYFVGYGLPEDINLLEKKIANINSACKCKVSYNGMLSGEEYSRFLQRCHIGLSTQTTDEKFASACFPSKIASYLSNGLIVVSSKSLPVQQSKMGKYVVFYDNEDPLAIANTIISIDINNFCDPIETIRICDKEFKEQIQSLIQRGNENG